MTNKDIITEDELQGMRSQRYLDIVTAEDMKMEKKALCRGVERRLQMEMVEADMEAKLNQEKGKSLMVNNSIDEKVKIEMMRLKIEKQNEEKIRLMLCQNSPELKELKRKVQKANIDKQVLAQVDEKRASLMKEKLDCKHFEDIMKSKIAISNNLESQKLEEANANKLKYKEELLSQITRSNKKQKIYNEFLRDKARLELTLQTIKEQNKREEEMQINKLKKLRHDIEKAKTLKELYDQQKKQTSDDEDKRIQQCRDMQLKREKETSEKNKDKERQKQQLQEKLYNNFLCYLHKDYEKNEREEISRYLVEQKLKENNLMRENEKLAQSLRWREELQRAAKEQHEVKFKNIEENKLQELKNRKQLEEDTVKDGNLAQIKLEKKHQIMLEYKNHLKAQIEEKHRQQIEYWQQETALEKLRQVEEDQRNILVNEERVKMLKNMSKCLK